MHILDTGLHRLYTLYTEEGEPQAMVCGGPDQWRHPGGLATDSRGALLVADTGNRRLLLLSKELRTVGEVEVDRPLVQPGAVCLAARDGVVVVHDAGAAEVVKFVMVK